MTITSENHDLFDICRNTSDNGYIAQELTSVERNMQTL